MNKSTSNATRIVAAAMTVLVLCTAAPLAPLAQGQVRHDAREGARDRFSTPHWVFDGRFHHNHYYPSVGYSLSVLPGGALTLTFRGGRFFFNAGVWFQPAGAGYVVVRPPLGIVVPVLPPAYTTIWAAGAPYYYANDVYYVEAPGGYVVAAPPAEANISRAPASPAPPPGPQATPTPGAPATAGPGTWYYCESAKGYYPYVSQCKEDWKVVPATPPQAR
jgi:hypothetical protein